jgi:hypothetical protein
MGKRGPQPKFNDREKWCAKCTKWLPLGDFGDNKRTASGKATYCKTHHNAYCRSYWTSVQAYEHVLMRDFQLSPEGYLALWRKQDHQCAVCANDLSLYNRNTQVDWDAANQRVRGLMCADCSAGLKKFRNSIGLLQAAVQYLMPKEST